MIKVRVLVEHQYETVQDYMKSEPFGLRFHTMRNGELVFAIFDLDPVSRVIENYGFYNITFDQYNENFGCDEQKLREYIAANPELVREKE